MAQNRTYPAETNKGVLNQYLTLPQEKDSVMCEYVWIDGTGEGVRSKCRTLSYIPKESSGKCIIYLSLLPIGVNRCHDR